MSDRDKIVDVMKATHIAVLTYEDAEGRLVSTPMGTQDFEDPSTVWFITASPRPRMIRTAPPWARVSRSS